MYLLYIYTMYLYYIYIYYVSILYIYIYYVSILYIYILYLIYAGMSFKTSGMFAVVFEARPVLCPDVPSLRKVYFQVLHVQEEYSMTSWQAPPISTIIHHSTFRYFHRILRGILGLLGYRSSPMLPQSHTMRNVLV